MPRKLTVYFRPESQVFLDQFPQKTGAPFAFHKQMERLVATGPLEPHPRIVGQPIFHVQDEAIHKKIAQPLIKQYLATAVLDRKESRPLRF